MAVFIRAFLGEAGRGLRETGRGPRKTGRGPWETEKGPRETGRGRGSRDWWPAGGGIGGPRVWYWWPAEAE